LLVQYGARTLWKAIGMGDLRGKRQAREQAQGTADHLVQY
jgi:hypothetical protein